MKKAIIKVLVVLATFVATVLITENIINLDTVDMTTDMLPPTIPTVSIQYNGITINRLYGYDTDMEPGYMRESITPLMSGRKMRLNVETHGSFVTAMRYEVRNVSGDRLIEDTPIEDFVVNNQKIISDITIKDLIETNTEYEFILFVTLNNEKEVRFYSRIIIPEEYYVSDKLEYVSDFSNKTFNKSAAEELRKYLEPNSKADNTNYGYVDIHSSFDQVTWGDLDPLRVTDPVITIKELSPMTGSFIVEYYVSTDMDSDISYYKVREFYRVRYSTERMYLLDYERTMDEVFVDVKKSYRDTNIVLGITGGAERMVESDDGNNLAFVTGGRLYSYNVSDNKMAYLYGFYEAFNEDVRYMNDRHNIKIMNVDEAGNVTFLVYGYINRGSHEGHCAVIAYYYDAAVNTIEELLYIDSNHAPDLLIKEVEQLSYMNSEGLLYLLTGSSLYELNSKTRVLKVIAKDLTENSYRLSVNNKMVAWQHGSDNMDCQEVKLMNLDTGRITSITSLPNETIAPLAFMGTDLIVGKARKDDITKDTAGNTIIPMYEITIQNELEGILMTYDSGDMYVIGSEINNNQITLHRIIISEEGSVSEAPDDQIMNSEDVTSTKNNIEYVTDERLKRLSVINTGKSIEQDAVKHLSPRMVLFEGNREIDLSGGETDSYVVYGRYGVDSFSVNSSVAVTRAYDISGIVMTEDGNYIYKKTSRKTKNQIMAIQAAPADEKTGALAVCLDTMLEHRGVIRNSQYMLDQGATLIEIMADALTDCEILDLSGCSLDMILYYVNQDIPVLSVIDETQSVLIIGFNETEIVVMDPLKNEVYKISVDEATKWFEEGDNTFITYVPKVEG